jgi:hypothetical protein
MPCFDAGRARYASTFGSGHPTAVSLSAVGIVIVLPQRGSEKEDNDIKNKAFKAF